MNQRRYRSILLPGGVLPAKLAYPATIGALGSKADARYKELELYATQTPPEGGFLEREVDGIRRFADEAGFDRFHLVGYSAGAASSLAFCAAHPDRLLSLTLNEPGWVGGKPESEAEREFLREVERIMALPPDQRMPAFVRLQLAPGIEPPPPPEGPQPPWMAQRIAALPVFLQTLRAGSIDHDALGGFQRPVLYTLGGGSHPWYRAGADRLSRIFPDFTLKEFKDRHHFDPPHRAEPEQFAATLLEHWERAERLE